MIITFPEAIPAKERDPQRLDKISGELAVIVQHLMQHFANPNDARELLQAQQSSEEALAIKPQSDPLMDFCGYLTTLSTPVGMLMGERQYQTGQSTPLPLSRLLVIYGGAWASKYHEPDLIRVSRATNAQGA